MANSRSTNAALHSDNASVSQALTDKDSHASVHNSTKGPMVASNSNELRSALGSR